MLWGTATCILCIHGRPFCSLSLKWNLIAQPYFPLGQMYSSSAPRGNLFWRRLLDIRSTVMHIVASLMTVMARPSCTTVFVFVASSCHALPLHAAQSEASFSTERCRKLTHVCRTSWTRCQQNGSPQKKQCCIVFRTLFGRPMPATCTHLMVHRRTCMHPCGLHWHCCFILCTLALTNTTPWCQGHDKAQINKAFGDFLTEFFTDWLGDKVENVGANEKVHPLSFPTQGRQSPTTPWGTVAK